MDTRDYQTTIRIQASPDAVFDALTTPSGLTAWWTGAAGSGETGGELRFSMNAPDPLVVGPAATLLEPGEEDTVLSPTPLAGHTEGPGAHP